VAAQPLVLVQPRAAAKPPMSAQMSSVVALLAVTNSRQAAESVFSWPIPQPDYSHGLLHCTFFARFHGGGAGCGDRTSSDGAGCNGDGVFCCDKAVCGDSAGCNDEAV
jgi:hypothetical protein